MSGKTVAEYSIGGRLFSIVLCWSGSDPGSDPDKFYDIYGPEGTCLNLGEPWHDDGDGPPSQADVECLVSSDQRTGGPT